MIIPARSCCPDADVFLGLIAASGVSTCAPYHVSYEPSTVDGLTLEPDGQMTMLAANTASGTTESIVATLTCDGDATVQDTVDVSVNFGTLLFSILKISLIRKILIHCDHYIDACCGEPVPALVVSTLTVPLHSYCGGLEAGKNAAVSSVAELFSHHETPHKTMLNRFIIT